MSTKVLYIDIFYVAIFMLLNVDVATFINGEVLSKKMLET